MVDMRGHDDFTLMALVGLVNSGSNALLVTVVAAPEVFVQVRARVVAFRVSRNPKLVAAMPFAASGVASAPDRARSRLARTRMSKSVEKSNDAWCGTCAAPDPAPFIHTPRTAVGTARM